MAKKKDTSAAANAAALPPASGKFQHQDKTYQLKPTFQKIHIPGLGERTAGELLLDTEAQAHLVKEKCFNLIEEVEAD